MLYCLQQDYLSIWWSQAGSNRRPSACKADALPAELTPLAKLLLNKMVGRGGLEPPTSRLSGVRSNHLSYRPQTGYRIIKSVTLSRLGIRLEEIRGRLDRFCPS